VVADFDITDDRVGDDRTVVVAVCGELEASTAERLSAHLRRVVDLGARFICLDLLGVRRIDWAGLTPVVAAHQWLESDGGAITVACRDQICVKFEVTGLGGVLGLHDNREDALAHLARLDRRDSAYGM